MNKSTEKNIVQPTCGIIMPISAIESCSPEHWINVLDILKDVCIIAGFIPKMVSEADDIGVIHKRIVENIYSSDIVICDVSCKNANVMFELGMRLAFDKPTIIIKDELTGYSFDTSLIEHLDYPRDLRFNTILKFKETLGKKLTATHLAATTDPNYSTFLKNFGQYKIAHLENKEVSSDTFILKAIEEIKDEMRLMRNMNSISDSAKRANNIAMGLFKDINEHAKPVINQFASEYLVKNKLTEFDDVSLQSFMKWLVESSKYMRELSNYPDKFRTLVVESIGANSIGANINNN